MPTIYERSDSPYWYAEIQVGRETRRVSTGVPRGKGTRKRALEAAAEKQRELEQWDARGKSVTLQQAALLYLDHADLKKSTLGHYAKKLTYIIHEMDYPPLADINLDWVKELVRRRRAKTSDIQIRRELTALSSVLEYAADHGLEGAPEMNPCRLFRKKGLKKPVKKPRWLQPEEVAQLLDAAEPKFWRPFLTLVLETGMRHEEALGLLWSEVDLDRRIINLGWDREKTKRGRIIPLSHTAHHTLLTQRRTALPFVFVNGRTRDRYKSIGEGFRRLRKQAGVPHARIHDLRHTFASWTRQSGMSREDRMDMLGHLDDVTHGGYANASIETLVESVNKHSPHTLLTQLREFTVKGVKESQ